MKVLLPLGCVLGWLGLLFAMWALSNLDWARSGTYPQTIPASSSEFARAATGPQSQPESPVRLSQILKQHGRATNLAGVRSLLIHGTYFSMGQEFDLTVSTRSPDLYRQTLKRGEVEVHGIHDGDTYRQESSHASEPGAGESAIESLNDKLLVLESSLAALCWHYDAFGTKDLELSGNTTIGERDCHILRNTALLDGATVLHYIDAKTGCELRRETRLHARDESFNVRIDYPSHPATASTPSGYQLVINNTVVARAEFRSIRRNAGVMPWMFSMK